MQRLKCPDQESILEFYTIPKELSIYARNRMRFHLLRCTPCTEKLKIVERSWKQYFSPEPEITPSLMRVYSRLQKDETLILKGWKLGESAARTRPGVESFLLNGGWLFRGGVSIGLAVIVLMVIMTQSNRMRPEQTSNQNRGPLAQIRLEDKNSVKVHYLQPELLQTIEFETTRGNTR